MGEVFFGIMPNTDFLGLIPQVKLCWLYSYKEAGRTLPRCFRGSIYIPGMAMVQLIKFYRAALICITVVKIADSPI